MSGTINECCSRGRRAEVHPAARQLLLRKGCAAASDTTFMMYVAHSRRIEREKKNSIFFFRICIRPFSRARDQKL